MIRENKVSELIMNGEIPIYRVEELKDDRKFKTVTQGNKTRYLTLVDDKHMKSITNSDGRELSIEELFDFVIGDDTTDLARTKNKEDNKADIAIVLGNGELNTTKERAIKAFELYKVGMVKKIIFTGGVAIARDKKRIMHLTPDEDFTNQQVPDLEWQDLPEADWGAETFVPGVFYEKNYRAHSLLLTEEFLKSIGVDPSDILIEGMSASTQENAEFCKNIFDIERVETGLNIKSAILVTTLWHGSRAIKQFKKVFGDRLSLKVCPSTLDLEEYRTLKPILTAPQFDEEAFRRELKNIYFTDSKLIKKLMEETANHRNAFIEGYIDDATIKIIDREEKEEEEEK